MEKRELPETQCPILKPPAKEDTPTSPPAANESASEERRVAFDIGDSEDGDKERRVSFDIGDSEDNEYRSADGGEC